MTVAYIALFGWSLVALLALKRFSLPLAVLVTLIFGYLLLPTKVHVDLPVLPTLNKNSIPAFTILLLILFGLGKLDRTFGTAGFLPKHALGKLCVVGLLCSSILTVLTNSDPLVYGPVRLPALRLYDGLSDVMSWLTTLAPFLLAHKYLGHPSTHRTFLKVMVIAGLFYSIPALYEVRMSPQLNNMVYGFFPHNFLQHMRGDGFRPLVFLEHGLVLAVFFGMAILAAVGLARTEPSGERTKYFIAASWLMLTLVLAKSLGALVIILALVPVALLLTARLQLTVVAMMALVVLVYPTLRSADYVPVERILSFAESFDRQRALSLKVRFENEDDFLVKIDQRPAFGWGGYGRSRVFDENGVDTSIADGAWVITLGIGGWTRYLTEFGLFCLPMILLFWRRKQLDIGLETAILAIMLTANVIDLIPNASRTPLTWMLAGALWGRLSLGPVGLSSNAETPEETNSDFHQYARPHPKHTRPGMRPATTTNSMPETPRHASGTFGTPLPHKKTIDRPLA